LRTLGSNYADIEAAGFHMPVTEVGIRYLGSFRYGEKVVVRTRVEENLSRRVTFAYEVINEETGEQMVSGFTKHIWTDHNGKVTRMPEKWAALFPNKEQV